MRHSLWHRRQFVRSSVCDQSRDWKIGVSRFSEMKTGESEMSKQSNNELGQ